MRQILRTNRSTEKAAALLIVLFCAGCASAPPPLPAPPPEAVPAPAENDVDDWGGSGGAASLRTRGEQLADFALSLRGAPYHYGGATPDGFDCSGLVFYAHRQLGLNVPRTSRDQAEQALAVEPRKLRRGDLVCFKIAS